MKKSQRAFKNSHPKPKSRSRSSSRHSSFRGSGSRSRILREIYAKTPIKILKMKVDNTYDYKLPPFYMEAFCQFMLESDEGMQKLQELHEKYPLINKKPYNVVDYINSMDYVVRCMELGLGLHSKKKKMGMEAVEKARESRDFDGDMTDQSNHRLNNTQDGGDNSDLLQFEEEENDSDDVFRNNPSNLMLAKVKVKKKVKEVKPKDK